MSKILIIEDEKDLLELLEFNLISQGYEVFCKESTDGVYDILDKESIDLLIVDRNLPKVEGSEFVKELRDYGYKQKVIFLTAKDSTEDVIEGFRKGGDDYITKPFDIKELKERVAVLLKNENILKHKDIILELDNKRLLIDNKEIKITPLEFRLIEYFLKNINRLISRDELLLEVWGDDYNKQYKTVNVAIKRLKDKIDKSGEKDYIKAVRGEGYIFC